MFRPLALFIGLRYTRAERKNGFISFISLISMIGLTLGVAVLITVLSVMNGFDREIKNRILGMIPQASVMSYEIIPDWQQLSMQITENDKNVKATAPFIQLQGMLAANGQVSGVMVSGIEPSLEKDVSIVDDYITQGSLDNLKAGEFGIVLGESMTQAMGVGLGDKVTLVLPEASPSAAGVIPRFKRFTVVGTFNISKEVDGLMGFVAMRDAGVMLRLPEGAQGIRMLMNDIFKAPQAANQAASLDSDRLFANDWTTTHGNLFDAIKMEKSIIGLLLFLIVIVAAFNIVSSLIMLVTDKKSDIAILKTFGASPKLIMQVFIVQGMIIGVIGTVLGTILGVTLALTVNDIVVYISELFGVSLMTSGAYPVDFLPSYIKVSDVVIIVVASFLLSFAMTIYPALRAARIQPAQTLRYE
ncbi:cell division protein FtsX [Moraxella ovis]|uniref:Cell division protein FtsX n=1 Tax=Moraxella ovis TaxID=29433 RepID=A0A378PIX8_9GAMM|nr:lipoprotein-releasing ABC transporter permease subunit [Moraxella ovis]ANB91180.1 cell division protein FtsX [Moraxella ovis]STY86711.1 Lipoprotein-releasing system transmembrane protein lolE [Moraxella ovis]